MNSTISYNGKTLSTGTWFHNEISNDLLELNAIILKNRKITDSLWGMYWEIFVRQSLALFEMCLDRNCLVPVAMTMRLGLEYAADLNFIVKYPDNIEEIDRCWRAYLPQNIAPDDVRAFDMAHASAEVRLWKYEDGKKKNKTGTINRIKEVFEEPGVQMYELLSCFSHMNYFGATLNAIYDYLEGNYWRQQRLSMIRFYPEVLQKIIQALGQLSDDCALKEYDFKKMSDKFQQLG